MPWGCGRFDRWCSLMTKAMDKGHVAVVFYKKGWLQEHGAENSVYPLRQDVKARHVLSQWETRHGTSCHSG